MKWSNLKNETMKKGGIDANPGERFKAYLSAQGFMNTREMVMKWPCGPWPEDQAGKRLGRLQKQNFLMALEVASLMLFTKQLGWTKEEVEAIIREAREDLGKHFYCRVYID